MQAYIVTLTCTIQNGKNNMFIIKRNHECVKKSETVDNTSRQVDSKINNLFYTTIISLQHLQ